MTFSQLLRANQKSKIGTKKPPRYKNKGGFNFKFISSDANMVVGQPF